MTEQNGKQIPDPQQAAQQMMDQFIWPVMATAINGLQVGMRQIPIGLVLARASYMLGMAIGQTLSIGDLASILRMRAECKKAFEAGLQSVKIEPPPQAKTSDVRLPH